jgi:hypothetical protein
MQKTVTKIAIFFGLFLSSFLFFDFASAGYSDVIPATISSNVIYTEIGYCSSLPTSSCFMQRCSIPAFASKYPTAFSSWPYPTNYTEPTCSETSGGCQTICNTVLNGWDTTSLYSGQTGQAGVFLFNSSAQPIAYLPLYSTNGSVSLTIGSPVPVNGVCGTSNQLELSEMPTTGLCTSGSVHEYPFAGFIWQWSCEGANGGTTENCFAYATGSQNVTPTCGTNNGQTFESWSAVDTNSTSYCSVGLQTNNAYTSSGQTWSCTTLGVATSVNCSFTVTSTAYPTLPTETDCSSYSIPDKWFCEMNNTLKSFFLPSQTKLDEFNATMNDLKNKAPFNYLSVAGASMNTLSNNINTKDIQMTFLGNTGTVNLDDISSLVSIIKIFSVIMISIAMFFWARIYITHFFK